MGRSSGTGLRSKKSQLRMALQDAVRAYLEHCADEADNPDPFLDAETEMLLIVADEARVRIAKG